MNCDTTNLLQSARDRLVLSAILIESTGPIISDLAETNDSQDLRDRVACLPDMPHAAERCRAIAADIDAALKETITK